MKEIIKEGNFEQDVIFIGKDKDKELIITFIKHSSLIFQYKGLFIYNDPIMDYFDYNLFPKADIILITHQHSDHFDIRAVEALKKTTTKIISNRAVNDIIREGIALSNGEMVELSEIIKVKAVAAYNTTEGRDKFHPKNRDNGYVLYIDKAKIYIAGDTEFIDEMTELRNTIDIAFIPVNQPYTMTIEQATKAAVSINPKILYPYHYGETEFKTPINDLRDNLEKHRIEVRIRRME
ncbi:MAG: MBL fold metallo-hydrolase [Bacteroidales bacterium]|nr:MBL fold metallo-hydrolase [Bacteroidales bacterium]MDD4528972.1 MBL fold metallo-hydrolase [Bacteroidales bacterium]MDD4830113.1 MBL fold metallo-hydrolase [Bacteroidales bacterium]